MKTTLYKLLLDATGMSQAEAAKLHGKSLSTIKAWCSGRRNAPKDERLLLVEMAQTQDNAARVHGRTLLKDGDLTEGTLRRIAVWHPELFED